MLEVGDKAPAFNRPVFCSSNNHGSYQLFSITVRASIDTESAQYLFERLNDHRYLLRVEGGASQ